MAVPKRKIIDYTLNTLLVVIVLILLIPSWRISFQGWFQGMFMPEAAFQKNLQEQIPENAQNWILFDMNDHLLNFKDFGNKPILLSFWATWCPPCRAELPGLNAIKKELGNDIHVMAVSEETTEVIRNSELHEDYDFLYSTTGIPAYYQVNAYPTLVIIDKHMNIVFRNKGAAEMDTETNRQFLKNLTLEP
jgi:thiol-disulfide isomerase/thioredoxin